MTVQTKVTALVPAYQAAEFIQPTLNSLSRQTHNSFSVIISVDLCDDETYEICLNHCSQDSRFSIIRQDSRLGYIGNCNFLIDQANSDYVTLAFHDDTLDHRYLKKLCAVLDSRPEVIMAYSDILANFEDGSQKCWRYKNLDGVVDRVERGLTILSRKDPWWVPAHGVFRLDAARKVLGLKAHAEGEFGSDWAWLFHMSLLGQFQRTPGLLVHKFNKESGVTLNGGLSKKQLYSVTSACMQELSNSPLLNNEKESIANYLSLKLLRLKKDIA